MSSGTQQLSKYICGYCQKGYVLKKYYNNHTSFCKIRYQTAQETKSIINEEDSHLSLKDLNKIVKSLVVKTDKMEKDIKHLMGFVDKTLKCANIVDLLNQTHNHEVGIIDFVSWYESIKPVELDLDPFFKSNFTDALYKLICKYLVTGEKENIKGYTEKTNKLFIYTKSLWKEISKEELHAFISNLRKKVLKTFQEWQIANRDAILNGDGHEDYADKVIKIMGGNKSEMAIANGIRDKLYNRIKVDMKSMTKIEL